MVVILFVFLLTGCSAMGDWLSGSAGYPSSQFVYPAPLAHITIGVTTQETVRTVFGAPTDLQTSVLNGVSRETWAYAQASPSINPLQYLPLLGVLALSQPQEPDALAISFSPDGIVDGVSIRGFQPYGDMLSSADRYRTGSVVPSYGTNNPMIHALQHYPSAQSRVLVH